MISDNHSKYIGIHLKTWIFMLYLRPPRPRAVMSSLYSQFSIITKHPNTLQNFIPLLRKRFLNCWWSVLFLLDYVRIYPRLPRPVSGSETASPFPTPCLSICSFWNNGSEATRSVHAWLRTRARTQPVVHHTARGSRATDCESEKSVKTSERPKDQNQGGMHRCVRVRATLSPRD